MSQTLVAIRRRATYANIVATLALLLSMGGTSYAIIITGAQVKNGSLTTKDIKNRTLTAADVKPNSLGSAQVGIIGPSDIRAGAIGSTQLAAGAFDASHLAGAAKVQLPIFELDRILIGLSNEVKPVSTVGPITVGAMCGGGDLTLRVTTSVENVTVGAEPDLDPTEASDYVIPLGQDGVSGSQVIVASTPAGDSYGIIVQGGRVAGQCSVAGIVVQGGLSAKGIVVQGG